MHTGVSLWTLFTDETTGNLFIAAASNESVEVRNRRSPKLARIPGIARLLEPRAFDHERRGGRE